MTLPLSSGRIALPPPDRAALCLDFDGVLVDTAERPDAVIVPSKLAPLLARAFKRTGGRVALISGRSLSDLLHFLPDFPGDMIGSHGAERRGGPAFALDADVLGRLKAGMREIGTAYTGSLFEDKPLGAVLHYRGCPGKAEEMRAKIETLLADLPGFALQPAIMAWDAKPEGVNKGDALSGLMQEPSYIGATPIYAGDDVTDEAALKVAQDLGGVGIKIGEQETVARHRLPDPAALHHLLTEWLS